jgi:hypothetical protein
LPRSSASVPSPAISSPAADLAALRREVVDIKARMHAQWTAVAKSDSDSDGDENDDGPDAVGDPPSSLPPGPFDPPADGGAGLHTLGPTVQQSVLPDCYRDELVGALFFDAELGWCSVTAWGDSLGTPVLCYGQFPYSPSRLDSCLDPSRFFSSEDDVLSWLRSSYRADLSLSAPSTRSTPALPSTRACPPVAGNGRPLRPILLSPRQLRRVMAAR